MTIMLFMAFSSNFSVLEGKSSAFVKKEINSNSQNHQEQEDNSLPLMPTEWYVTASHNSSLLLPSFQIKALTLVSIVSIPEFSLNWIGPINSINRFRFRDLMLSTISISTRPFRAP